MNTVNRDPATQQGAVTQEQKMTYTFTTVDLHHIGSSYGYHSFTVVASSKPSAWDAVRKLTSLVLTISSIEAAS